MITGQFAATCCRILPPIDYYYQTSYRSKSSYTPPKGSEFISSNSLASYLNFKHDVYFH